MEDADEITVFRAKLAEEISISNQRGKMIEDLLCDMAALSADLAAIKEKEAK